ncbi:MAG: ATP-binding protein [Candidatus Latescibacteria bacterium]|nr:ATP-binding protein [Candidatus Latescibacterota bacterium]
MSTPGLPAVEGDAMQLEQVFLNLCLNARDAVEGLRERSPRIDVVADLVADRAGQADFVRVTITENGTGMSEVVSERIFDPFYTTKEPGQGTGLGLSIVHGVTQQHGGRVECESQQGEGTTMTVYLPVSSATLTPVTHDPASDPTGDEKILVIEDEPMVRDVVGRILERRGCSVSMAVNGVEGLESIADLGDTLDLVLLDLSMPVMSGEDVLEQLSVTRPELPVVVFTGYVDLRHRSGQVAALLPKPVRPSELLRTIRQALGQR